MKKTRNILIYFFSSALVGAALSLDFAVPDLHNVPAVERATLLKMPEFVWNVYGSINVAAFVMIVALLLFIYVVRSNIAKINIGISKISIVFLVISVFVGINLLFAKGFVMDDTVSVLFATKGQAVKSIIYLMGVVILLYYILNILHSNINLMSQTNMLKSYDAISEFRRHFLILFFVYLVFDILNFPGALTGDMAGQLQQYFGTAEWSSHHPPASSFLSGLIIQVGSMFGGGNAGLFFMVLIQTVCMAAVCAYMLIEMKKLSVPNWLYIITWICMITSPYYNNYVSVAVKDELYSIGFALFEIEFICLLRKGIVIANETRHIVLWNISSIAVLLLRNNGKYALYPTLVFVFFYGLYHYIKAKRDNKRSGLLKYCLLLIVLPVLISICANGCLNTVYSVEKGSIREALSIPIQQTARYVKYYEEDVTEDEKEALLKLFDFESLNELGESYVPKVSDYTKIKFVYYPSIEQLLDYFRIWLSMGIRHPGTYIAATMNQNFYLFDLSTPNNIVNVGVDGLGGVSSAGKARENVITLNEDIEMYNIDGFSTAHKLLFILYQAYFYLPIIGYLAHPALYTLIMLACVAIIVKRKTCNALYGMLPIALAWITVILAPAIQRHPRYMFPVIFSMPIYLAFFLKQVRDKG